VGATSPRNSSQISKSASFLNCPWSLAACSASPSNPRITKKHWAACSWRSQNTVSPGPLAMAFSQSAMDSFAVLILPFNSI
jgi:hypothetical protein